MTSFPLMLAALLAPSAWLEVAATGAAPTAVGTDFALYDLDRNGALDRAEFGNWLVHLRGQPASSAQATPADPQGWLDRAFAQADANRDGAVSPAEMASFIASLKP